ncbi:MAG: aspartate--tRNA ligase [Candidatus Kapabacteria bacterium]|nr:aspartate--tRNA ligase [Candidatus Kapabacteria bacterium]MDW8011646.1 aspartate--tRNA ligase [Bacteroidota bacterium]
MPFPKRTTYCGELRLSHAGQPVVLNGWLARLRDLGGILFMDIRDHTGVCQAIIRPTENPELARYARQLSVESVLWLRGTVQPRENPNPQLPTGHVEVAVEALGVLNPAATIPFPISDDIPLTEELRLRYRYLDLRRPRMQHHLRLRHRVYQIIHRYFDRNGFVEIETPILTRSTPEGARDFLVPCRLQPGRFYALPQSPQLFKQLLMVAGFDRYMQIAKCFRDEDLRADRQPEFTQVDVEMAFVDREDVLALTEGLFAELWHEVLGIELSTPFPRLSYTEAMMRYGSDKPDLRYGLELETATDIFAATNFSIFRQAYAAGHVIAGLRIEGGSAYSRKELEELGRVVSPWGLPGVIWLKYDASGWQSPILKHLSETEREALRERFQLQAGDLLLLAAAPWEACYRALGALRRAIAERQGLTSSSRHCFVWIVDFPLLEYSEAEGRYVARHHPFTAPVEEDIPLLDTAPERVRAQAYDLVLNGEEIGGGSIRIHMAELQQKVFSVIGLPLEEATAQFGFLLEAFRYGAPPHGGIALGLDRIVMLMASAESIRDVIAFPKTTSGASLMDGAPAPVRPEQLDELGICLRPSR